MNVLRTPSKEELEGVDFIIRHFSHSEFPRKISTFQSNQRQFPVMSKNEIISSFNASKFVDCRIAAFPYLREYVSWAPDLIFIDIDKSNFKNENSFKRAYNSTLKNINGKLNGNPTVLLTGGGYHIYQPIEGIEFEKYKIFNKFNEYNLFKEFLKFSKDSLSNNKADKNHNPSLNSCLLRIPGSVNSKHQTEVKIIQKWNGLRPSIKLLIGDFLTCLTQRKIENGRKLSKYQKFTNNIFSNPNTTSWIEKLLQTPINDFRKYCLWKILCPYLINIKKTSPEESFLILDNWLDKCDRMKALGYSKCTVIKDKLRYVKHYKPISLDQLKKENSELYNIIKSR